MGLLAVLKMLETMGAESGFSMVTCKELSEFLQTLDIGENSEIPDMACDE